MTVVLIIVGDDSLGAMQALEALQRETNEDPICDVNTARADGSGDHVAASGSAVRSLEIPVGKSFAGRGMRRDQHGAVAVTLTVGVPDIGAADTENPESRGASQPAASDTCGGPFCRGHTGYTQGEPFDGRR